MTEAIICSMFVLMLLGHPIAASLPDDLRLGERFWYWRGRSGRAYIHSIYASGSCPPVAGAVYVVVDVRGGNRRAIAIGRFPQYLESRAPDLKVLCPEAPDSVEIHIHLLARNENCANAVLNDLTSALWLEEKRAAEYDGFCETPNQLGLIAA